MGNPISSVQMKKFNSTQDVNVLSQQLAQVQEDVIRMNKDMQAMRFELDMLRKRP